MQSISRQAPAVSGYSSLRRSACLPRRLTKKCHSYTVSRTRTCTPRGLQITCLKNYSGHEKVSTPRVNENGIVVCVTACVCSTVFVSSSASDGVVRFTALLRSKTQTRHLLRKYCVQIVARLLSEYFVLGLSWAYERWELTHMLLDTKHCDPPVQFQYVLVLCKCVLSMQTMLHACARPGSL